jgi:hypothetical protein
MVADQNVINRSSDEWDTMVYNSHKQKNRSEISL